MLTTLQYWERKKLETTARRGRRLSESMTMGEWILAVRGTWHAVRALIWRRWRLETRKKQQ